MASSKEYLEFILEQLSGVEGLRCRGMMGEYILYCRGKIFGGIYDDRLLVKTTPAAKEMLLVDRVEDPEFLRELVTAMAEELPEAKKRRG